MLKAHQIVSDTVSGHAPSGRLKPARLEFCELEPRIVFDAAAGAAVVDVLSSTVNITQSDIQDVADSDQAGSHDLAGSDPLQSP